MQPFGLDEKEGYDIVYNIDNLTFEINSDEVYNDKEKVIINNHISKFLQKFEKKCLDGVIQVLIENNYGKVLPSKRDIKNKNNRFDSIVEENFLDYLEDINMLKREAIIRTLEKKIKNSTEGIDYNEIVS